MDTEFINLKNLLRRDRSVRRFKGDKPIDSSILISLVELTRFCASGRNLQPLKYRLINSREECNKIFPLLKWAGYLSDWDGPEAEERPTAYLIQGLDTRLTKNCLCDEGLQLQAITLGATALGLGGCIIKSFNAPRLQQDFNLPEWFAPGYVLALGYPAETVIIEDIEDNREESIKYYRTPDQIHHVPKRLVKDLII